MARQVTARRLFEIFATLAMRHGLGLTLQVICQQLAVLEQAGLVVTERRGRCKFHNFNREPFAASPSGGDQ